MGQQLNETLKAFMEDVMHFITVTFVEHEHATGTGPSGPAGSGTDIVKTTSRINGGPEANDSDQKGHGTTISDLIARLSLHLSKVGKTK